MQEAVINDNNAEPIGVFSGHHRYPPVPVTSGGAEAEQGLMKSPFMIRESRPKIQHGLEKVQDSGILPGEIVWLELLDPAEQDFREQAGATVVINGGSAIALFWRLRGDSGVT